MPRPTPARLETLSRDQLVRLAKRQARTIARLDRNFTTHERLLGERLTDLRDLMKERDHLAAQLRDRTAELGDVHRDCTLFERQGRHVKALYEAMLQRYVGAKLDTQQFSFAQAQQFLRNETNGLEASLGQIREQVDLELSGNFERAYVAQPADQKAAA